MIAVIFRVGSMKACIWFDLVYETESCYILSNWSFHTGDAMQILISVEWNRDMCVLLVGYNSINFIVDR